MKSGAGTPVTNRVPRLFAAMPLLIPAVWW
jgi:hypothetical protein